MIEVAGKCNTAICYTDQLEPVSFEQIKFLCDRKEFADCKIPSGFEIRTDYHPLNNEIDLTRLKGPAAEITGRICPAYNFKAS